MINSKEAASIPGVKPEMILLSPEEQQVFINNAAQLNYLMTQTYLHSGGAAAELAMYAFRMGREFEANKRSEDRKEALRNRGH